MCRAAARVLMFVLWFGVALAHAQPVRGQDTPVNVAADWTPGTPIPLTYPSTLPPIMIADQNHTVHAFASMPLSDDPTDPFSEETGIFYRQWTLDGGWTKPTDILLTPIKKQARVKSALLDDAGVLHLVFFGGDEQQANTYYVWAPAASAASASAWSAPLPIGPSAITPEVAAIAGDGGSHLVVLYSGNLGEGNSLYVVYSDDAGVTWSEPALLFSTYALDTKVFEFQFDYGESGTLHAVWNVTDAAGQNVAGFYAHLDDLASRQWSEPKQVAESVGLGFANASLIEYQGAVLMIFNNGLEGQIPPVMWFIRSDDGGQTFTEPVRPFPNHIGRNGAVAFVVDSSGALHGFWGQRIGGGLNGDTDLHGMWRTEWTNGNWGPARPIVSGASSPSFDPADATAVISQGNTILLTWRTDPGREIRNAFYAYHVLDTPETPVVPLPMAQPAQVPPPSLTPADGADAREDASLADTLFQPAATGGAAALPEFSRTPADVSSSSPATPIVGALAPTILFVIVALLLGGLRRR